MQTGKNRRLLAARQTGRIILAPEELFAHYSVVFFLLLFPLFYLYGQTRGTGHPDGKPYFEAAVFTLAVGLLFRQHRTLALMQYRVAHTPEQFREAARATAIELDWHILDLTDDHLIAEKHGLGWQWDGLRITALRSGDAIFINSMVKPSFRSNPFSFGWNSRNRNTFYQNLLLATQGENPAAQARKRVKEAVRRAENESEWTLKNTLKRLVAYVSIVILAGAGVLIVSGGVYFKYLIPLAVLTLGYLAADWYMILKKRKKTRKRTSMLGIFPPGPKQFFSRPFLPFFSHRVPTMLLQKRKNGRKKALVFGSDRKSPICSEGHGMKRYRLRRCRPGKIFPGK